MTASRNSRAHELLSQHKTIFLKYKVFPIQRNQLNKNLPFPGFGGLIDWTLGFIWAFGLLEGNNFPAVSDFFEDMRAEDRIASTASRWCFLFLFALELEATAVSIPLLSCKLPATVIFFIHHLLLYIAFTKVLM